MNTWRTTIHPSDPGHPYHVGDERGSEPPGQEVIPVDVHEKGMFPQLRLNTH